MILLFTIPETLPSMVLHNKAKRLRRAKVPGYENAIAPIDATDRSLVGIFKVALTRPWIILFDPISLLCAIYISVVYCLLYMLFSIYPIIFQEKRGWNAGVGELPLIGTVLGAAIGGGYVFWSSAQDRKKLLAGYVFKPEDRLSLAMIGGAILPPVMFWFAWTGEYNSIHWIACTIAGVFIATAVVLIFIGFLNYLTDTYLMYAASALAANTVARSAAGAAAPLFTRQMFSALGVGGGGSLIGGVALLLAPIPFIFYKYGAPIRERSRFAPTKKPEENKDAEASPGSERNESDEEEDELDEQAGVPGEGEVEKEVERERSSSKTPSQGADEDRFLDASGMEKAEKLPA